MNAALEFHDSDIESIQTEGGSLRIVFLVAYIHRSTGRPGIDSGSGYVQSAQLSFGEAQFTGVISESRGRVSTGHLLIGAETINLIPLPFSSSGSVYAELVFENGSQFKIEATSVSCFSFGEAKFIEHFKG